MSSEYKNYGLKFNDTEDPNAYVLGGLTDLPKKIINPSGDWRNSLPIYEAQFNQAVDSHGCTVWGTQNAIEILIKHQTGVEPNYSELFNYILAGVRPPGADPHDVMESIRGRKVIDNDLLPFDESITSIEQLNKKLITPAMVAEAQKWPYDFQHAYVWRKSVDHETRRRLITENLKYSPLAVSVTAWIQNSDGLYIDAGLPNSHWCVLFGVENNGYLIFDSYDQAIKIISFYHQIEICKRIYLPPKALKQFWLWELLRRFFG